jgi:hypothetical protein
MYVFAPATNYQTVKEAISYRNRFYGLKPDTDIATQATGIIRDGLFEHHLSFTRNDGTYFYYKEFFGTGWHKRKPNAQGWVKYKNALAYNVNTHALVGRRKVEGL